MPRNRIVFWQEQPSPHQSSYLRALTQLLPATQFTGVFVHPLEPDRRAQGWQSPDLGRMEIVFAPDDAALERLVGERPSESVHVFNGLRVPMVRQALQRCARTDALLGLVSEARDWLGWRGKLRLLHSHVVERPYRRRMDFVLGIGHLGVRWYELCGYRRERIFPWAYFVEPASSTQTEARVQRARSTDVAIALVGRLVEGKGIETLFAALAQVKRRDWSLQIVGGGPVLNPLKILAAQLGIAERLRFLGVMQNAAVWQLLAQADLMVFPSCIDGWGAVVNEALMSGVPVVCSDYPGAADLIRDSDRGELFAVGSPADLARVLERWIGKGRLPAQRREDIRSWSHRLDGVSGAQYFIDIMCHLEQGGPRPAAPWLARDTARDGSVDGPACNIQVGAEAWTS